MEMGQKIKKIREEKGMTLEELGNKVGVGKSTVRKWENGMIANMRRDKISKLANALECSPSYLMGWENNSDSILQTLSENEIASLKADMLELKKGIKIPVLGNVAAGIPIFATENYIASEEIPKELAATGKFFGLRIKGDSMSPRIMEGDIVIVKQQDDAESGDIVIVLINGDSATCKRLMKYQEGISLISFNPSYEPMTFSNKDIEEKPIKIIGKVVENRQKYY